MKKAAISFILMVSLSVLLASEATVESLDNHMMKDLQTVHQKRVHENIFSNEPSADSEADFEKIMAELKLRMILHQLTKKYEVIDQDPIEKREKSVKRGRTFFIGRK